MVVSPLRTRYVGRKATKKKTKKNHIDREVRIKV